MKKIILHSPAGLLYALLKSDFNKLENNARSQYGFHRFFTILWFLAMPGVLFFPSLWAHSLGTLIVQELSLWALFATHFGAMSASLAAINTENTVNDLAEDVGDISDDIDDVHSVTQKIEKSHQEVAELFKV